MRLRKIRNKLIRAITKLEARYDKEYTGERLEYAQIELINILLNYLKSLEYHYRDDVRGRKNNAEYKKAMSLFKRIGEPINPSDDYSRFRLKSTLT